MSESSLTISYQYSMADYNKYGKEYSDGKLWKTIKKWGSKLGEEVIYNSGLLF